jgi:hypothetical protein
MREVRVDAAVRGLLVDSVKIARDSAPEFERLMARRIAVAAEGWQTRLSINRCSPACPLSRMKPGGCRFIGLSELRRML